MANLQYTVELEDLNTKGMTSAQKGAKENSVKRVGQLYGKGRSGYRLSGLLKLIHDVPLNRHSYEVNSR